MARVGIIGCGGRLRGVLKPQSGIEIVALCDPHPESIRAAQTQYGGRARVYGDHNELVRDPAVEWVAVGSWNSLHAEHAIAALRAGKHVFCEKPLATTLPDCLAIRDAVRHSGRHFSFRLVLRYAPVYRQVRELLRAGKIGKIISFEFNETLGFNHGGYFLGNWRRFRRNGGSYILEKCCHDMDLANWLVDSLPVRAASFGGLNFFKPENQHHIQRLGSDAQGRQAYRTWPGVDMEDPFTCAKDIVDNQVVILEYANGVRATFHTNANAGILERRFYLLGAEGAIRADAVTGKIECQRIGFDTTTEVISAGHAGGHAGGDEVLRASLYQSMQTGTAPLVGVDEALRSAVVCFGIDQALDEGRVVDLRPLWEKAQIDFTACLS